MSDQAQSSQIPNWDEIAQSVSMVVSSLAPLVTAAFPAAGAAVDIGTKIIKGVLDAEPTAVALYDSIVSGNVPTQAELETYMAAYESSYQKLKADLDAADAADKSS